MYNFSILDFLISQGKRIGIMIEYCLSNDISMIFFRNRLFAEKAASIKMYPRSPDMIVCGNITYAKTLNLFFQKGDVKLGKPIIILRKKPNLFFLCDVKCLKPIISWRLFFPAFSVGFLCLSYYNLPLLFF